MITVEFIHIGNLGEGKSTKKRIVKTRTKVFQNNVRQGYNQVII